MTTRKENQVKFMQVIPEDISIFHPLLPLTQFIKVCVNAIGSWHRTNQTCFEESCPFVYKAPVSTKVILITEVFCINIQQWSLFEVSTEYRENIVNRMTFRENNREEFTLYIQKQYYVAKTPNLNYFYFTLIVPYIILVHNLKPETLKSLYITLYNFIHIQHWEKRNWQNILLQSSQSAMSWKS